MSNALLLTSGIAATSGIRLASTGSGLFIGSNNSQTAYFRIEAEAPFSGVQLRIFSCESVPSTGWTAVVAATETCAEDTSQNCYQPIVGGVAYNSMGTPGWTQVTQNGSTSMSIPAGTGGLNITKICSSDIIPISSVPRADGGVRPAILIRLFHPGSVGNTASIVKYIGSRVHEGEVFYRVHEVEIANADGVGTLTNVPTLFPYGGGQGGGEQTWWIGVRFISSPAPQSERHWLLVGDSITCGVNSDGTSAMHFGFLQAGILSVSTPSNPNYIFDNGYNGQTDVTYFGGMNETLSTNGLIPTDIVIPSGSPNGTVGGSNASYDNFFSTLVDPTVALCKSIGAKLSGWTQLPKNTYNVAFDNARLYGAYTLGPNYLASGKFSNYWDVSAIVSDGASPAQYLPQYFNNDTGIHPNPAALNPMLAVVKNSLIPTNLAPVLTWNTWIYGRPNVGSVLLAIPPQIVANPAATVAYQWQKGGVNIGGATSQTYTVQAGDSGSIITVVAVAANINGTVTSTSLATTSVLTATTNKVTNSSDLTLWTNAGLTSITGGQADPTGGTSAFLFTEDTTNSLHGITSNSTAFTSGQAYTLSVYALLSTTSPRPVVQLYLPSAQFGACFALFNLQSGQVQSFGGTNASAKVTSVYGSNGLPTGWVRLELTAQATASSSGSAVLRGNNGAITNLNSYVGTSLTWSFYGPQLEQRTPANNYVPT